MVRLGRGYPEQIVTRQVRILYNPAPTFTDIFDGLDPSGLGFDSFNFGSASSTGSDTFDLSAVGTDTWDFGTGDYFDGGSPSSTGSDTFDWGVP